MCKMSWTAGSMSSSRGEGFEVESLGGTWKTDWLMVGYSYGTLVSDFKDSGGMEVAKVKKEDDSKSKAKSTKTKKRKGLFSGTSAFLSPLPKRLCADSVRPHQSSGSVS